MIFLPGGRASTSMPVVSMLAGSVRVEPALAAGEQPAEDPLELRGRVVEGLGEDPLDPLVDLLDDVEQVALGLLEVLELVGEELVPLLERGELLERQRVDPAEGVQRALGLAQPLLLDLAHERRRARAASSGSSSGPGDVRHELVRAELLHEHLGVDAELLDGLGLHAASIRSRCWVRATSSRWTVSVRSRSSSCRLATSRRTGGQRLVALGALVPRRVAPLVGPRCRAPRDRRERRTRPPRRTASATVGLAPAALLRAASRCAGGQLVAGRALEGVGPALEGAGALLPGAQGEAQLGLGGAGPAGRELEAVALVGARAPRPRRARRWPPRGAR